MITSGNATGARDFQPGKQGLSGTLLYTFRQDVPMASYLFAIASGDIAMAAIGPRSLVATAPEELCASKWELEDDMENFIVSAESILKQVPYAWGTYNALILPPSFPYGGMENPVFTFATPSIISGDRENVDVIAHELAHSWSGNLVSNASWEHFWLNEGWTMYLERRIIAAIYGEPYRSFSAVIGWKALAESVNRFGDQHEFTKLVIDLKGQDPDEAFSSVPYEKGFVFLYFLENLVGKELFDRFISRYFSTFARRSLDSFEFRNCIVGFFASVDGTAAEKVRKVDWNAWFYQPGLPPKPELDTSLVDACYALADRWLARAHSGADFIPKPEDVAPFRANQLVVFLEYLEDNGRQLSLADVRLMGQIYNLAASQNLEVLTRWLVLALQSGADQEERDQAVKVLGQTGRMKFVRPLLKWLIKADREVAVQTFEKYRDFYHPICRQMMERMLAAPSE